MLVAKAVWAENMTCAKTLAASFAGLTYKTYNATDTS